MLRKFKDVTKEQSAFLNWLELLGECGLTPKLITIESMDERGKKDSYDMYSYGLIPDLGNIFLDSRGGFNIGVSLDGIITLIKRLPDNKKREIVKELIDSI